MLGMHEIGRMSVVDSLTSAVEEGGGASRVMHGPWPGPHRHMHHPPHFSPARTWKNWMRKGAERLRQKTLFSSTACVATSSSASTDTCVATSPRVVRYFNYRRLFCHVTRDGQDTHRRLTVRKKEAT